MKSLMLLWKSLAYELASGCDTSATMDWKTVLVRCKHEGLSFLTITLPTFGKDFEKSLDQGKVDRSSFQGFTWRAGLPRFLGGFLDRVFDRRSGVLLHDPDIEAIRSIRQLTLMFGKVELPCSDARWQGAMSAYVECDREVKVGDSTRSDETIRSFERISDLLFQRFFTDVDRDVYNGEIVPKHGPGATADKLSSNSKYRLRTWTDRLEEYFPAMEFLLPSPSFYDERTDVDHLEPGAEVPVKVTAVPKTQKTPRIIAIEPACMQYVQQGLLENIRMWLQEPKHSTLFAMIGFESQDPNQMLALEGSLTGELATLDLSEASDRVSNQLVRSMLRNHPWLFGAVDACRSRKADVPGHSTIRLAKFASMGSALTFPMEAMVFLTAVFVGIERALNTQLTRKDVSALVGRVRIFGDDIIVPRDYVYPVVSALEDFGLRVNASKSFWTGRFRESCGKEYYAGEDVTIVRVRTLLPTTREDATEIISTVSTRNQLYWAGRWKTVGWLDRVIRGVIRHYPLVAPSSSVLGRESVLGYETQRTHKTLHSPLVKGYAVSSRIPSDPLDGPGALLKFHLKRGGLPSADEWHLERSGRPSRVRIKRGWFSPF
jgi:hypothetical protein